MLLYKIVQVYLGNILNYSIKHLALLKFKCWYYDEAIKYNSEDNIKALLPNNLPDDIQALYDEVHNK